MRATKAVRGVKTVHPIKSKLPDKKAAKVAVAETSDKGEMSVSAPKVKRAAVVSMPHEDPIKHKISKSNESKLSSAKAAGKSKKPKTVRIHEAPIIGPTKKVIKPTAKKSGKVVLQPPAVEDAGEDDRVVFHDDDDDDKVDEDDDDDDTVLGGLEGVSDEEDEEDDALASRAAPMPEETAHLPSSRDDAVVRQRLEAAKRRQIERQEPEERGVVYVGRLPHGFFEDQLRSYFSQFGDITRLRLSRNKKTGHSRHYGFIEFANAEVAEIAVETMNNYLLDGHLLQMRLIPADKVDANLWIGANRKYRRVPAERLEQARRTRSRSSAERARVQSKLLQREKKRRAALARMGIEYEFPGYQM